MGPVNTPQAGIDPGSQKGALRFSEANSPWQAIPRWVGFLLKFGYVCADPTRASRRITLISMPCESAAVGLVVLGAVRRRLALSDANDSALHFQRIEREAIKPNNHLGVFLRHNNYRGRFRLEGRDDRGVIWVRNEKGGGSRFSNHPRLATRFAILPFGACEWYFDGEAPVKTIRGALLPHTELYEPLVGDSSIVGSNLSQSDSGICLAGRVAGEAASKAVLDGIRFQRNNHSADLSRLLSVQNWSPGTVSRVTFFNARTRQLDRNTGLTRLAVADGDVAFLRVLESKEFKSSDVLGVIHRTVERERLEAVGYKIAELQQWYVTDTETATRIPPMPPGITVLTLKRR